MRAETKATSIPRSVKLAVWLRDGKQCILCRRYAPIEWACAHIIRRSQGGRGIEQNIVTLCPECHREFDEGKNANICRQMIEKYISELYPGWSKNRVIYRKGDFND